MAKGGRRYQKFTISIPKSLYSIIEGIALKDKVKMNRLIRRILEKEIEKSTVGELKALLQPLDNEEVEKEVYIYGEDREDNIEKK